MRRNAWKDIANCPIQRVEQLDKVSTPCLDDHQFKKEEFETVGEVSKVLLSNRSAMLIFGTDG